MSYTYVEDFSPGIELGNEEAISEVLGFEINRLRFVPVDGYSTRFMADVDIDGESHVLQVVVADADIISGSGQSIEDAFNAQYESLRMAS